MKPEGDRQIAWNLDLPEQQHAGVADAEAERAAGEGDEQALGNQLANKPSASGADREAERHLARANGRAARQQPGDVSAGHEQHPDRKRRQHRNQRRVRRILRDARLQLGFHEELLVLVRRRIGALEVDPDRRQLGLRLRLRDAGLEPSFHPQVSRVARLERARPLVVDHARRHHQRHEEIRAHDRIHAGERLGRHADDRERHAVDPYAATQDACVRPEFLFPQRPAEHDDGVAAGDLIFVGPERAADCGFDTHQRDQIAAGHHPQREPGCRRRIFRKPDGEIRERREAGEARAAIANVRVVAVRRHQGAGVERLERRSRADRKDLAGTRDRKRTQQQRIGEREDGGVRADADGQREHRDGGEARACRQHAEAVAEVLPQGHIALLSLMVDGSWRAKF